MLDEVKLLQLTNLNNLIVLDYEKEKKTNPILKKDFFNWYKNNFDEILQQLLPYCGKVSNPLALYPRNIDEMTEIRRALTFIESEKMFLNQSSLIKTVNLSINENESKNEKLIYNLLIKKDLSIQLNKIEQSFQNAFYDYENKDIEFNYTLIDNSEKILAVAKLEMFKSFKQYFYFILEDKIYDEKNKYKHLSIISSDCIDKSENYAYGTLYSSIDIFNHRNRKFSISGLNLPFELSKYNSSKFEELFKNFYLGLINYSKRYIKHLKYVNRIIKREIIYNLLLKLYLYEKDYIIYLNDCESISSGNIRDIYDNPSEFGINFENSATDYSFKLTFINNKNINNKRDYYFKIYTPLNPFQIGSVVVSDNEDSMNYEKNNYPIHKNGMIPYISDEQRKEKNLFIFSIFDNVSNLFFKYDYFHIIHDYENNNEENLVDIFKEMNNKFAKKSYIGKDNDLKQDLKYYNNVLNYFNLIETENELNTKIYQKLKSTFPNLDNINFDIYSLTQTKYSKETYNKNLNIFIQDILNQITLNLLIKNDLQ